MTTLRSSQIRTDGLQAREVTDAETVAEYRLAMEAGVKFPPITVFHDGTEYFLADGFHRLSAAAELGEDPLVDVEIKPGTQADALWFACGANQNHGLRRTNADKRKAVVLALGQKPEVTDRAIAGHVGVSHLMVANVRRQLAEAGQLVSSGQIGTPSIPDHLAECKETQQVEENATCQESLHFANRSVPPGFRRGQDGKLYPAPPPAPVPPLPPPAPRLAPPVLDQVGRAVPKEVLPLWNRVEEVKQMLRSISEVRVRIKQAQDEGDVFYAGVSVSNLLAQLNQSYALLKEAIPHAVCPVCQGYDVQHCRLCRGRGYVSEHIWNTAAPRETRERIERMAREQAA